MKKSIQNTISDLTNNSTDKLMYYYEQGFEIGKEEALYEITNQMILENIDRKTISKITKIPLESINQIIENP